MRSRFLSTFTTTYCLRPVGDIGSVFRCYPDLWQVWQITWSMCSTYIKSLTRDLRLIPVQVDRYIRAIPDDLQNLRKIGDVIRRFLLATWCLRTKVPRRCLLRTVLLQDASIWSQRSQADLLVMLILSFSHEQIQSQIFQSILFISCLQLYGDWVYRTK